MVSINEFASHVQIGARLYDMANESELSAEPSLRPKSLSG